MHQASPTLFLSVPLETSLLLLALVRIQTEPESGMRRKPSGEGELRNVEGNTSGMEEIGRVINTTGLGESA